MNPSNAYLVFLVALLLRSTNGFGIAPTPPSKRQGSTSLSYSEHHTITKPSATVKRDLAIQPGFEQRLHTAAQIKPPIKIKKASRRSHVLEVLNMKEFKQVVTEEKYQIVVVRFYAAWCRVSLHSARIYAIILCLFDSSSHFIEPIQNFF